MKAMWWEIFQILSPAISERGLWYSHESPSICNYTFCSSLLLLACTFLCSSCIFRKVPINLQYLQIEYEFTSSLSCAVLCSSCRKAHLTFNGYRLTLHLLHSSVLLQNQPSAEKHKLYSNNLTWFYTTNSRSSFKLLYIPDVGFCQWFLRFNMLLTCWNVWTLMCLIQNYYTVSSMFMFICSSQLSLLAPSNGRLT